MQSIKLPAITLKRWTDTGVVFKADEAQHWISKPPDSETPHDILNWARKHPFLKVAETAIPNSIITDTEAQYTLHDIRVHPPSRKRKGPKVMDDDVYDMFPFARIYVPRGLTILQTTLHGNHTFEIIVYAMKKFTGGPGDEDDEEENTVDEVVEEDTQTMSRWENYFIEPYTHSKKIYRTTKENGDSSHLSFWSHKGQIYHIFGSKNVHLLIKDKSDLVKYTDPKFRVASLIAETMLDFFSSKLDQAKRALFTSYMLDNKLTATFEFLQVEHQHVELFDFKESKFRFLAFTYNSRPQEVCMDVAEGVKIAKQAGLETTTLQEYDISEQSKLYDDIRFNKEKVEGSVLYYVSGEGRMIGMMKKKTIWYVLARSTREKAKGYGGSLMAKKNKGIEFDKESSLSRFRKTLPETFSQKQTWLGFSTELKDKWTEMALAFLTWLYDKLLSGSITLDVLGKMFPAIWNQFLQEEKLSDTM
eukprot:TRINITY_DN6874_c0_g1_i1.p1 TRINITY_DN6874_c0_g1~~TRINITY_DN6874_c0_g1_i1.p1  ORF type:complete len:474 (-),score=109.21 TRINITY_DN6874_c0_g1_i1:21-1442(-)